MKRTKPVKVAVGQAVMRALVSLASPVYHVTSEGKLPEGPVMLAPTHQRMRDPVLIAATVDRDIRFAFGFRLPSQKVTYALFKVFANLFGYVDIANGHTFGHRRNNAELVNTYLNSGILVGLFPQGQRQRKGVISVEKGLVNLVKGYERRFSEKVAIVPVGIKYTPWHATVVFGEPIYSNGQKQKELTEIVMKESARLSNLPYLVNGPA